MSTSQLQLYNAALTICGERHLASLTEDREPRRLLDHVWSHNGIKACLEKGQWGFAMRTLRIDYDTTVSPDYGYIRAFSKPSDWVVTSSVCSDEYFNVPLTRYEDEAGYWYADLDEIYVRFVSNDANYGGDLSLWSASFVDYVSASFAAKIILKLTSDDKRLAEVKKLEKQYLSEAKSISAMGNPQRFPAPGNFVTSRGRSSSSRDRGNRGQLIG